MWDEQKFDAFLHSHSLVRFCCGSMPGLACWGIRSMEQNWDNPTEASDMRQSPAKMAKPASLQLTMDAGMSPAEPSLRSADPVSQPTDPWTKANVYHVPLRLCGCLLYSIIGIIVNWYKLQVTSPLYLAQGRNISTDYFPQTSYSFFPSWMGWCLMSVSAPWCSEPPTGLWAAPLDASASFWSASEAYVWVHDNRRSSFSIFMWILVVLIFLFWWKMAWSLDGFYGWKRYHIWDPEGF